MTREVASVMTTPHGDFVCLFHEAESLSAAFGMLMGSTDPYDAWFRQNLVDIHGLTPEMMSGPPPATLKFDWPNP